MKLLIFRVVLIVSFLFAVSSYAENPPKVLFISAANSGGVLPFWQQVEYLTQSAADDLGIELEIKRAYGRFESAQIAIESINSDSKPDYIISFFRVATSLQVLMEAEKKDVKIFMINTDIPNDEKTKFGKPRKIFKNWIGHMLPNDESGGFILANVLIDQGKKLNKNNNDYIPVIAGLSGGLDSSASVLRTSGLQKAVRQSQNTVLKQIVPIHDWSQKTAFKVGQLLLARYPETNIIWCASQVIAAGAIDAIKVHGKVPGKDILVGGVGWSNDTLNKITKGEMNASIGGHFLEGAWALILIYDYHNGLDFAEELGTTISTNFDVIVQGREIEYLKKIGEDKWQNIKFRKFSKKYSGLQQYDFTFSKVLDQAGK